MQEHLKDYVWMQLGEEPPIKVTTAGEELVQRLVAGYHQVDEPEVQE